MKSIFILIFYTESGKSNVELKNRDKDPLILVSEQSSSKYNLLVERHTEDLVLEQIGDISHQQSSIPVIRDVATIADSRDQVFQGLPWGLLVLVQVNTQNAL